LEQQAEERDERNPATVAAAFKHQYFEWNLAEDRKLCRKLTL